ncbi:general transcription factor 3C polypeptide 1-like [Dendronephthya gigantea]|uniref:general transcription factor 3C polypeptide 1-like n=1 Tax=Dendronephthya gigantea TaxID=151771 RepID=UPI00106BBC8F|nr:general transcription factor 3C polypeptide 1-like [Dendronephthya gigantea]
MNGVTVCLEEIALEGLDGITIGTLWKRLDSALLFSTIDESYKEFLWRCVSSCRGIKAYLLESPRAELLDFNEDSEVYSYCCINDDGIRGSCSTYKTRTLINISKINLSTALATYGNRLVLVASQLLRNKVLLGPEFDASISIPETSYCLLEIIGRARKLGRLQSNLGLQTMVDSRSLFAQVKTLLRLQLITKQSVIGNRRSPSAILYLTKYHTEHGHNSLQFKITKALGEAPDQCLLLGDLHSQLEEDMQSVEKVVDKLCKSGHVCYVKMNDSNAISSSLDKSSDVNPDSSGGLQDTQDSLEDKESKVIQFIHPFYNLNDEDGNELEDEEWLQPEKEDLSIQIPAEMPVLHAIYNFIESKGTDGASLTECCQTLSYPFFGMRQNLENLECLQVVFCKFIEEGNAKRNVYIARKAALPQDPLSDPKVKQLSQIATPSNIGITQSLPVQTSSTTTDQISKPEIISQECKDSGDSTTQPGNPILQNSEGELKENLEDANKPCSTTNSVNGTKKSLKKTRSQKLAETERFVRRKAWILNLVKDFKVLEGKQIFIRYIRREEKKLGLTICMDRRTVANLLDKLAEECLLRKFEMNIKLEEEEHQVEFFCDVGIQKDSEEVASCVQRFKDKIIIQGAKRSGALVDKKINSIGAFQPKMRRVELLHMFLFYVIYELSNPNVNLEEMRRKYEWAEHLQPEYAVKMIGKGWFTPSAILLLLPVSLYFQLVDIPFHNHVLQKYFNDPATKNMLLKDLPPLARQILFEERKNYFLFGTFEYLTFLGLITPTNKQIFLHERDIACYLHNSTSMKDTRESVPGYHEVKHPDGEEFPEEKFSFSEMADVEQYWDKVSIICLFTPLNRRKISHDVKSRSSSNFEALVVDEKEVQTCGKPRGDGLGAGGFDSHLYSHLLNKWKRSLVGRDVADMDSDLEDILDWQSSFDNYDDFLSNKIANASRKKRKSERPVQEEGGSKKKRKLNVQRKTDEIQKDACSSAQLNMTTPQSNDPLNPSTFVGDEEKKKRKKRRKKRKVDPNKPKRKPKSHGHWNKLVHDKRDEEALKQKLAKRNTFTRQQHKLLFICCLALRIIGKKSVDTGYSDWLWTRDVLYKDNYESAKTKTALSISRKYRVMIRNAQTKTNLDICVADCLQGKEFQPYCNTKKNCDEAMFNELVELLKKKYSMENLISNHFDLPSTIQQFNQQRSVHSTPGIEKLEKCDEDCLSLEPREISVCDVRQRVIRDAIVSALLANTDNYQSSVAFRFLSQFTEEELIIAISLLKNGRIVVRKSLRYANSGHDLASCAFGQMLSKHSQCIIDHQFPSSLFQEVFAFYDKIADASKSRDDDGVQESLPLVFSESSIRGGEVCCILSLLACKRIAVNMEVPDIFLVLEKQKKSKAKKPVLEKSNERPKEEVETRKRDDPSCLHIANTSSHDHPSETNQNNEENAFEGRADDDVHESEDENLNVNEQDSSKRKRCENNATNDMVEEPFEDKAVSTSQSAVISHKDLPDPEEDEIITIPGNINRKRSNDMVLDVLCGIEDHLFGFQGIESSSPVYKVNLKPTSSFTCTMTTSYVDHLRAIDHVVVGDVAAPSQQYKTMYESYVENISTYQRTGDLKRILFSINPCKVRVRLLSAEKIATPRAEQSLEESVAQHFKSNGLTMPETIEECITLCSKMFGYTGEDCEALKTVYETVHNSKEIGMSVSKVDQMIKCERLFVSQHFSTNGLIKVLEAFKLVYQVGFVEVCYVTKAFKQHWFLNFHEDNGRSISEIAKLERERKISVMGKTGAGQDEAEQDGCAKSDCPEKNQIPKSSEDMAATPNTSEQSTSFSTHPNSETRSEVSSAVSGSFDDKIPEETSTSKQDNFTNEIPTQTDSCSSKPCRPWITMAGEMNKDAYNTLHQSVLAYIIKYPGVQKYAISKHYVNLLFQVALDDILQKLEDCGCIERHFCYVKKTTLFSSKTRNKSSYYLSKPDSLFKLVECVLLP